MEWMDSHTALTVQQGSAAIAQLHSRMPHLLTRSLLPSLCSQHFTTPMRPRRSDSSAPNPGQCGSDATAQPFLLASSCMQPSCCPGHDSLHRSSRASRPPAAF